MTDYYLKAPDEATMTAVLLATGVAAQSDTGLLGINGHDVSIIGVCYERTGGTDEDPVYTAVPGYHGNVRSVSPITWPETVELITPATPWRVWG